MKYGYIRVSTKDQSEDRQMEALLNYGISRENIFIDKMTGKTMDRPGWNSLMSKVVIGDEIAIKELDRLGRNLQAIKDTYDFLEKRKVFIKILENDILSTIDKSETELKLILPMVLHLLGYMAEKEKEKINQRQKEGIATMPICEKTGKRKGKKKDSRVTGRPNILENISKENLQKIRSWIGGTMKLSLVIKETGISRSSLYRIKKILDQ